jgi:hypothetical protein
MVRERWKPVVGYEGWYAVSDRGRVKRVRGGDRNTVAGRILRQTTKSNGYLSVMLCRRGETRRFNTHKLVAEAFLGPCPDGYEIDHENDDRQANCEDNLRYVTIGENRRNTYRRRLTEARVREARKRRGRGETLSNIAASFGVSPGTISAAVHFRSWKDVR